MAKTLLVALCFGLAACHADRAPDIPLSNLPEVSQSEAVLTIDPDTERDLFFASCPENEPRIPFDTFDLSVEEVGFGKPDDLEKALNGVIPVGAWHLTSQMPGFGGLSGLEAFPRGGLLAISDAGTFFRIGFKDDAPLSDYGHIAYMHDETGKILEGKAASDAEGLALIGDIVLVSFERTPMVRAYGLSLCDGNGRGIIVTQIDSRDTGLSNPIPENSGLEALTHMPDGSLLVGLEAAEKTGAPIAIPTQSGIRFQSRLNSPKGLKLTGLDTLDTDVYALFRDYSPLRGNTIEVRRYESLEAEGETLIRLKRPLTVDNFEGIALKRLPDGTARIFIISDDNFSARQRTLLMAFDVAPDAAAN